METSECYNTTCASFDFFFFVFLEYFRKTGSSFFRRAFINRFLKKMRKLRKTATLGTKVAQTSDSNLLLHKPVILGIICCKEL